MANADRPSGFRFVGNIDGADPNGALRAYSVDASNATAIFRGDALTLEADGNVTPAAAGGVVLGICEGIKLDPDTLATEHPGYLPASTAGTVLVRVGPNAMYEVQEDSDSANLALTDVGANIDLVAGAGSTVSGVSGHELDSDSATAAGSAQFRIIGKVDRVDNEVGTNCKWIVTVHESHLKATNGV